MHGFLEGVDGDPNQAFAWGDEKMQARSHGESFLAVLKHRFTDVGVYFLDEPEAALSFQSCLGLVSLLDTMRREGSQVIVATHSPLLVSLPGATFFLAPMSERRSAVRPRDMEATLENAAGPRTTPSTSKATLWTARILGGLLILFLLVDAMGKILRLAPYVEGTAKIGFPPGALVPLGLVLLVSTVLYAVPRTAVLGAVLLTGYLGGAIATHVHMGQSFAFPLVFGVIAWACLYVRDARLRALLPLVRS